MKIDEYVNVLIRKNKILLSSISPGDSVIDFGCARGNLTRGIASIVGESGNVVGIDISQKLINEASLRCDLPWLKFQKGNVYRHEFRSEFDIATSSRLMQWLIYPKSALESIALAVKNGGTLIVSDYNYEKIIWDPSPPPSMLNFYAAFQKWRSDRGLDNRIADNLAGLLKSIGLIDIQSIPQHELSTKDSRNFIDELGIWAGVVETKGKILVTEGYVNEFEREKAFNEYVEWMHTKAQVQQLYFLSVKGKVSKQV